MPGATRITQLLFLCCTLTALASAALEPGSEHLQEKTEQEETVSRTGRRLLQGRPEGILSLSTLASSTAGGELLTVTGSSFATRYSYFCKFTWDSSGYSSCGGSGNASPGAAVSVNSTATLDQAGSDLSILTCATPAWPEDLTSAKADFSILGVDSSGTEITILPAFENITKFYFLDETVFNNSGSPQENGIYVEGVNCAGLDVNFSATQAHWPLRMHLEYTPLQPLRGESFIDDTMPIVDEILRKTDPMPSNLFTDASLLDLPQSDGSYCIGSNSFSLQLPYSGNAGPQVKTTKSGAPLNILDNSQQPSSLVVDSVTGCQPSGVCGRVRWNVSSGWEGFAYKLCMKAVPAGIPLWGLQLDRSYVGSRCIYVIVPKCSKCVAPDDTLFSIAQSYSTSWLDLWSVNPELTNTTAVMRTDEVFNTPGDLAYPFVETGESIRIGLPYTIRAQDSLYEVGRRFGMGFTSLLALNPDVTNAIQDLSMTGKTVCVLASAAKYNECPKVTEAPNPLYFEEVLRYDERGVPIKVPNPRYPLPPH